MGMTSQEIYSVSLKKSVKISWLIEWQRRRTQMFTILRILLFLCKVLMWSVG
jgi:hypothetical protein